MTVPTLFQSLSHIDSRLLAALGGVTTCVYVHSFPMCGDVGLVLEFAFAVLSFAFHRITFGSSVGTALSFVFRVVAYHCLSLAAATVAWRISPFHPLANFPGPLLHKITSLKLAHIVWTGRRHLVTQELHERYGMIFRIGPNTLSINSHTAISPVYSSAQAYPKSHAYVPGKWNGDGLFFIQPRDLHSARRKHWAPAFTPASVASYKPLIERRTHELMGVIAKRRSKPHGVVNLSEAIQHWSYDVMGELTFGRANRLELMKDNDLGNYVDSGQAATVAFEVLGQVPSLFDVVWHLPTTKTITILGDIAASLLLTRSKSNAGESDDLASHLLGEHDSALPKLSFDDLRLDVLFGIQAGSDTTSGVLTFVFFYLLSNREAYKRLREELDDAFPDYGAPLNRDILMELPYLGAVVEESLRLGTPFPALPRVIPKGGATLASTYIPEGTIVGIPAYSQAINPENFWPEPEAFKPERWLPGGLGPGSRASKHAVLAFSWGPFGCLGKPLALQELRVVTAKTLLTYDLELLPDFDQGEFVRGIQNMRTTIFKHPLRVIATPRHE